MSKTTFNPVSTSGVGFRLEHYVQVAYIASLIVGIPVPFSDILEVTELGFQAKHVVETDDLLVTFKNAAGQHKHYLQSKKGFEINKNETFEKVIQQAYSDFTGGSFNQGRDKFMSLSTEKELMRTIKDSWEGNEIKNELKLMIGPVGSGAAVISNSHYIANKVKYQRKMIAIDMETYAVFYGAMHSPDPKPTAISIKSVSDHANANKSDNVQKYCSYVSAKLTDHIIHNILFE